jgi:hypothetical protein
MSTPAEQRTLLVGDVADPPVLERDVLPDARVGVVLERRAVGLTAARVDVDAVEGDVRRRVDELAHLVAGQAVDGDRLRAGRHLLRAEVAGGEVDLVARLRLAVGVRERRARRVRAVPGVAAAGRHVARRGAGARSPRKEDRGTEEREQPKSAD